MITNSEAIKVRGTPVIVFGTYNFNDPLPWQRLGTTATALDICESEVEKLTSSFINTILKEQKNRELLQRSHK